jgi:hypothetical protein
MTMDFSRERYVRVYTRDTADWLALSWDAQALLLQLLRKVDRAGGLSLGRHGRKAIAIVLQQVAIWEERLAPALDELIADGCVVIEGAALCFPNYVAAQESKADGALRTAEWRARKKAEAAALMAQLDGDGASQCSDAASTQGDDQRHEVTIGDSMPCRAVPIHAVPEEEASAPAEKLPSPAGQHVGELFGKPAVVDATPAAKPTKPKKKSSKPETLPTPAEAACRDAIREKIAAEYLTLKGVAFKPAMPGKFNRHAAELATAVGNSIADASTVIGNAVARAKAEQAAGGRVFWFAKFCDPSQLLAQLADLRGTQPSLRKAIHAPLRVTPNDFQNGPDDLGVYKATP